MADLNCNTHWDFSPPSIFIPFGYDDIKSNNPYGSNVKIIILLSPTLVFFFFFPEGQSFHSPSLSSSNLFPPAFTFCIFQKQQLKVLLSLNAFSKIGRHSFQEKPVSSWIYLRLKFSLNKFQVPSSKSYFKIASPSCLADAMTVESEVKVRVAQSRPTLCYPMGYTVHGILQARILEWVASPFSSRSSQPRNLTGVSGIAGGFFTNWAWGKTTITVNVR